MKISFACGKETLTVRVPDDALVYASRFLEPSERPEEEVLRAVAEPIGAAPLRQALAGRHGGPVVVVASDVTRPLPYASFLPALLEQIEGAGVARDEILILIATGMHRPSTPEERVEMFGGDVVSRYRIEDHRADDEASLVELPGRTWSGTRVRLNRRYVEAGFRLLTGLVEPHFMAGFSGGPKALCPGLVAMETIRNFHGCEFLSDPAARNGNLEGNPLQEEALSVARLAGVDFLLNVVVDRQRRLVAAFAGELVAAHRRACRFVSAHACPAVGREVDVAVTSSGGYPLDATFYQCVKGFVSATPAVKRGGAIVAFGGCSEGIGSAEYAGLMRRYAGDWRGFLRDIRRPGFFVRDQWQLQVHARTLERTGQEGLHFVTDGLTQEELDSLCVTGHSCPPGGVERAVQALVDELVLEGRTVAVFPEGPYCAPVPPQDVKPCRS